MSLWLPQLHCDRWLSQLHFPMPVPHSNVVATAATEFSSELFLFFVKWPGSILFIGPLRHSVRCMVVVILLVIVFIAVTLVITFNVVVIVVIVRIAERSGPRTCIQHA